MEYDAVLAQVIALLQRERRLSYRVLKRRLHLDDETLEDLKEDLIYAKQLAVDEDGRVLVWTGAAGAVTAPGSGATESVELPDTTVSQDLQVGSPSPAPRIPDAERRQLTVLFCDLVDSTVLASQLDPEDWREVVQAYQATCAAVIQRYDGHIAQYLGDGLLVYFGYPQAHDDDARRAVQAGLDILTAMATQNTHVERDQELRLAVRAGIHTGLAVVGEVGSGGRHEPLALGDTPHISARLQGLAQADTVVISAATHRLVQGYFTVEPLGPQPLKGVAAPVPVYRILGTSTAQSRLEVAAAAGLTPLVGRASDLALLLERWAQSRAGLGQAVLLSGEAGIGKSRLVAVLQERVVAESGLSLAFRCSPYHTQSTLYPVIEHLQRVLAWSRDETPAAILDRLARRLQLSGLVLDEAVPLMAALLSVPVPEGRYPPLVLTPAQQRQRTLDALVAWLLAEAERQPVLVVWEDLHWADPSTLELLSLLIDQVLTARLLTLMTARPEFRPPWAPRSHLTQLTLGRLPHAQVEMMVRQLTGDKSLPAEVLAQVIANTDGVPLFVEELVKMLLESGVVREEADRYVLTEPLPRVAIPATLQDSLMARLDRLSTARTVAQFGAVLGREFTDELIRAVAPLDETTVQRGLAQLVDAELLYQRGRPPQAQYRFKHALIQEAAYQSLLKSTRQQAHQRSAEMVAERFPEIVETQPELVAQHYTEAGLPEQAIPYWQRAGQRAHERSAHREAIDHLTKGLALLHMLSDSPARAPHELTLHLALGRALIAIKGFTAPEVVGAYARARELCRQVGEGPQLFEALRGLCTFYQERAELPTARELAEQLLRLAQRGQDPALLLWAHNTFGYTVHLMGELPLARAHLEQSLAFYDPQHHRAYGFVFDPGVDSLCTLAHVLHLLGYPDQALRHSQEALTLARELAHPFSLSAALRAAASVHHRRGERPVAQALQAEGLALAREQGFAQEAVQGTLLQGWGLVTQGRHAEGMAQMRQGLDAVRVTGAESDRLWMLSLLAAACRHAGQVDEGLGVVAEALTLVHHMGPHVNASGLYRLKGDLLLLGSDRPFPAGGQRRASEAESCFRQALDVARRQEAKSLELRAAMSLARLRQQQGKRDAARALLAPIYGWFTEGFDTADLQETKALLEELS